jgi:hypothetical protein
MSGRLIANNELGRVWKGVVIACNKIHQILAGTSEKIMKCSHLSRYKNPGPFEYKQNDSYLIRIFGW